MNSSSYLKLFMNKFTVILFNLLFISASYSHELEIINFHNHKLEILASHNHELESLKKANNENAIKWSTAMSIVEKTLNELEQMAQNAQISQLDDINNKFESVSNNLQQSFSIQHEICENDRKIYNLQHRKNLSKRQNFEEKINIILDGKLYEYIGLKEKVNNFVNVFTCIRIEQTKNSVILSNYATKFVNAITDGQNMFSNINELSEIQTKRIVDYLDIDLQYWKRNVSYYKFVEKERKIQKSIEETLGIQLQK